MGGVIKISLIYYNFLRACYQMINTLSKIVCIKQKIYFIWWVWNTKKCTFVVMISYSTKRVWMQKRSCCGVSHYKVKDGVYEEN